MAASSTLELASFSNINLISARCTGFAKVKGCNDYAFIIDLEWSDDRSMSVKRTYQEFQAFHSALLKLFPELKQLNGSQLNLRTSIKENMTNLFSKDKRGLAEAREPVLDMYIRTLLRQPERIRKSNQVLSFFEPRATDPKPCKCSSPAEKSDSGIDLTSDKLKGDLKSVGNGTPSHTKRTYPSHKLTTEISDNEYEGDTSETETDDDTFDDEYLLDMGFGDLMLQTSIDESVMSNSQSENEVSMWCSNTDKFANILKTSMTNSQNDIASHRYDAMYELSDNENDQPYVIENEIQFERENSDTESQMIVNDRSSDGLESDDEFCCKPVAQTNLTHYFLSSADTDITNTTG